METDMGYVGAEVLILTVKSTKLSADLQSIVTNARVRVGEVTMNMQRYTMIHQIR